VTIPPNTVLQSGEYFVLSGQDVLPQNCGNVDSAIRVDLNWNTCNCTNTSIPATGDGFMQNGGNANEKIVLLDPNLNVIDAVSTNLPVSASVSITTPALSGECTSKTFNLGTMGVNYESTGPSTGISNSIARKVDGDCGWVKTTSISAGAPNKTGSSASATYDFTTVSTTQCNVINGSISIQVNSGDVSALFPMNYTLGYDAEANLIFDANDQYTYGVDNSAPTIDINNLAYGRYRVTVGSSSSCNLKSFDFYVFNCYTVVLPVRLLNFNFQEEREGRKIFHFKIDEASTMSHVVLEARNEGSFQPVATLYGPFTRSDISIAGTSFYAKYRLKLVAYNGAVAYSQEINTTINPLRRVFWPNPVVNSISTQVKTISKGKLSYTITNSTGVIVKTSSVEVNSGEQTLTIPASDLSLGVYYLKISGASLSETISFRFIK
jgi:hypothetical protein